MSRRLNDFLMFCCRNHSHDVWPNSRHQTLPTHSRNCSRHRHYEFRIFRILFHSINVSNLGYDNDIIFRMESKSWLSDSQFKSAAGQNRDRCSRKASINDCSRAQKDEMMEFQTARIRDELGRHVEMDWELAIVLRLNIEMITAWLSELASPIQGKTKIRSYHMDQNDLKNLNSWYQCHITQLRIMLRISRQDVWLTMKSIRNDFLFSIWSRTRLRTYPFKTINTDELQFLHSIFFGTMQWMSIIWAICSQPFLISLRPIESTTS
jgi:hypothetical protein